MPADLTADLIQGKRAPNSVPAPRKTALASNIESTQAVLFADVADSTRLYASLGDREALRQIGACLATMRAVVEQCGGRVVKTIGDELMCAFADAGSAGTAAVELQTITSERHEALAIRVGFDCGPVISEGGDLYGDTVNVASRMAQLAQPGQILATARALDALPNYVPGTPRPLSGVTVKGKTQDLAVGEIVWCYRDDMTMVGAEDTDPLEETPEHMPVLHLSHASGDLILADDAEFRLGRARDSNIVIIDTKASRNHAVIVRRRDKFVLVDGSSNGTFVAVEGNAVIRLKREELILSGTGVLGFGQSPNAPGADTVTFLCE
jgi:adenylate cyclase